MITNLRNSLNDWFNNSKLLGLYIVGSYSLNEQNDFSDIDLLGISKELMNLNKITILRDRLRQNIEHNFSYKKIGFRVRCIDELKFFQSKSKSWGYDIFYSKKVFGIDINSILPKVDQVSNNSIELFDNLIEKAWYDLLFLSIEQDYRFKYYNLAKSLLDILHFVLYFNGIFYPTHRERANFIKNNKYIIDGLPITTNELELALNVKYNQLSCNCQINLDELRHNLLFETYQMFLPNFVKFEYKFTDFKYWSCDFNLYKHPFELIDSIFTVHDDTAKHVAKCKNIFFIWRIVLIEIILRIDRYRISCNDIRYKHKTISLIKCLFKYSDLINDNPGQTVASLLVQLEDMRVNSSIFGKDSSGKFKL